MKRRDIDPPTSERIPDVDEVDGMDEVDEASMESFPASDPPSYWGRHPGDDEGSSPSGTSKGKGRV